MENKEFTEYLKEYCINKGITAYELSELTGISRTYCYRLIKGEMTNPSLRIIRQINVTLNLNYEDFLNNTNLY